MRFIKFTRRISVARLLTVGDETMRKTTGTALAFALGLTIASSALAQSEPSDPAAAQPQAAPPAAPAASQEYLKYKGIGSQAELEERRARIAKKREEMRERRDRRMAQQIERLKERANKLRSQAASKTNELDKDSLEREAQRLDQKVGVMQERQQRFAQNAQLARATGDRPSANKLDPTLSREQRAKIRKAQMRRRWGQVLGRDDVTQELKVHAERAARLRRIRALAKDGNKDDLVQRSNRLLALEQQRHLKKMQSFEKDETGSTPAAPNEPAAVQAPAQPAPTGEESK
jgi:hypothetical protein